MILRSANAPERHVGRSHVKRDGEAFLRGEVVYAADIDWPGALHVALVRSTVPHARIDDIDVAEARQAPGVRAVVTGADLLDVVSEIPHSLDPAGLGGNHAVIHPLATAKVVHVGEPVVAVVAASRQDAVAAAALVRVSYDPLPFVLDADAALEPDAPQLYEAWGSNRIIGGRTADTGYEAGAAEAAHRVGGTLTTHRGNAAPMEPRSHVAHWDPVGQRLTMHAATQNPHPLRSTLSQALGLREDQVHVVAPTTGGSFGLKMYGNREDFVVAALARVVGGAVRWSEDRGAALQPGARDLVHRWEAAYDDDGRVRALKVRTVSNHGAAAPGHGWGMAFVGAMTVGAGYAIDHVETDYDVVATNKAPWGGTKPFGKDSATLLLEQVMDEVARQTGLDPIDVRRRNLLAAEQLPHVIPSGLQLDSGDYAELLRRVLEQLDVDAVRRRIQDARDAGRLLGLGVAFELSPEGADIPGALVGGYDTSTVRMGPDGSVSVLTGVTSPGSGNDTAIGQIVADELGTTLEAVRVVQGDTDRCPYGYGNISSRSLVVGGGAAALAARDIAAKLRTVAARMLEVEEPAGVVLLDGFAIAGEDAERRVPLPAVAQAVYTLGYVLALGLEPNLESTRTWRPPNIRHTRDEAGRVNPYANYPYCWHAGLVEVDPDTGQVSVLRWVVGHDCGTVVNPAMVDGQVRGGVVMGLSSALGEEFAYGADGVPESTGFKTYLLARADDLPELELVHLETPSPFTLLGAKGAGEAGFAGAQSALLSAVNDALSPLGARLDRTPASAPNVLDALLAAR